MRSTAATLVLLLGMAGVAHAGLFSDDEAHRKIDELQKQTAQQLQGMEGRLAKLEAQLASQGMLELLNQIELLKNDLSKLRGQLEVQVHEVETTQKRQKDLYADLDARLRSLEHPAAAAAAPSGGATPAAQPAAGDAADARVYDAALNQFKVGNYQGAIAGFQNFLKSYPDSGLAPSAQYWIGNSHFALRDFKAALEAQRKLIDAYPASQKVADAMLNIASSQSELGDTAAARKTLEELVKKYPTSNAAELAQKRLGNIK